MKYPNFINHLRSYISLSTEEIAILITYVKPIALAKKTFLLKEGQVCRANYFVEKGCLRMFFINDKGVEQITQFALENWWMSDHMSLIKQLPAQFYIQSLEQSEVVAIDYQKEKELFEKIPQLETYFRIMLQRTYAASQMRIKYFHTFSKEENYRFFIAKFPEFAQRIPQYMLASYLGLTPEYVSELRKKG